MSDGACYTCGGILGPERWHVGPWNTVCRFGTTIEHMGTHVDRICRTCGYVQTELPEAHRKRLAALVGADERP